MPTQPQAVATQVQQQPGQPSAKAPTVLQPPPAFAPVVQQTPQTQVQPTQVTQPTQTHPLPDPSRSQARRECSQSLASLGRRVPDSSLSR